MRTFQALLFIFSCSRLGDTISAQSNIIQLPTRYNPLKTTSLLTPQYFVVPLCAGSSANLTLVKLTINLPKNPTWDTKSGGVAGAEISSSNNTWNAKTIIAVNYVWVAYKLEPNPHSITFPYNSSDFPDGKMYLRFKATEAEEFTFQLTFTNVPINFKGAYDKLAFGQEVRPPGSKFEVARQFIRLSAGAQVPNVGDGLLLQFQFCAQTFPSKWGVQVTILSSVGKEDSAFDLWLCPAQKPAGYCNKANTAIPAINTDLSSTSIVSATIERSADTLIEYGILALVGGRGGTGMNYLDMVAEQV